MSPVREFVFRPEGPAGAARAAGNGVLPIGDPRFSIADGGRTGNLRRTWLDTFDWRLFRAGLNLEHTAGRGTSELTLMARDDEIVTSEVAGRTRWPAMIDALPAGPLRERIAPVVGVRALLPVAQGTVARTRSRVLNADEKTIAFLTVDHICLTQPRQANIQPRLTVSPLRGYQAQAAKLADALLLSAGIAPASQSAFEVAVFAVGRKPGDYSSKIDVQLTSDMPAAIAVVTVLARLFETVQANTSGTIRDIDTEFLHDLRVAVRRTRSVLKLAGPVLPEEMTGRYRPAFKWLGDLTTPTRDLDVYLLSYPEMAGKLAAATESELRPFRDYLTRQRSAARRRLVGGLRSAQFTQLASRWPHDLKQAARSPARRPQAGKFAARRIGTAHRLALKSGAAISAASPPEALHDLRKRCKELRYLLEVFASLHEPTDQWRAVNELKALQDCLGEFQDTEVQQHELRAFARRMMADGSAPADTLLAMGEIAATLAVRQRAARAEFAGRFADFASPRGRARIEALTAAGRAPAAGR